MTRIALLIPFYNEEQRFDFKKLTELATKAPMNIHVYLIDDGSTDWLANGLRSHISNNQTINVFVLQSTKNLGKAEAIRYGLCNIKLEEYSYFGFTDADFSSEPDEILRLANISIRSGGNLIFGCREMNDKNQIITSRYRYFQGELFSLITSKVLGHHLRDSQCGLKFIPVNRELKKAISTPFINQWLLDLELLLRLSQEAVIRIEEIPLRKWTHKTGSKVRLQHFISILWSLAYLRKKYGALKDINLVLK